MVDFLRGLVKISLYTAPIVLLLLLIPGLLNGYSAKWRRWMWLALALRLVIPVTISIPLLREPVPLLPQTAASVIAEEGTSIVQGKTAPPPAITALLPRLAIGLWLLGAAAFLLIHGYAYLRFRRRLEVCPMAKASPSLTALWRSLAREMKVLDPPRLVVCPAIDTPTLARLWHPILLLPHDDYSPEEAALILHHELVHHKRGDLWYKAFLLAVNALHWFNPLVYLMARQASHDIELSCDEMVTQNLDNRGKSSYARLILSALPIKREQRRASSLLSPFGSAKGVMEKRVRNLFAPATKGKGALILCTILVLSLLSGGAFTAAAKKAEPPQLPPPAEESLLVQDTGEINRSVILTLQAGDFLPATNVRDQENIREIAVLNPGESICLGTIEMVDGVESFQPSCPATERERSIVFSIGFLEDTSSQSRHSSENRQIMHCLTTSDFLAYTQIYLHNNTEEVMTNLSAIVTLG